MIDWKSFNSDRLVKYLHDGCRIDPTIKHSERFTITYNPNPKESVIFRSRSNCALRTTKNYLSKVWA